MKAYYDNKHMLQILGFSRDIDEYSSERSQNVLYLAKHASEPNFDELIICFSAGMIKEEREQLAKIARERNIVLSEKSLKYLDINNNPVTENLCPNDPIGKKPRKIGVVVERR